MNKKNFRGAVERAIEASNKDDARHSGQRGALDFYGRKYDRLNAFLSHLSGGIQADCPEVSDLISEFCVAVIRNKNPQLNAVDSSKEPK